MHCHCTSDTHTKHLLLLWIRETTYVVLYICLRVWVVAQGIVMPVKHTTGSVARCAVNSGKRFADVATELPIPFIKSVCQ